MIRTCSLTPLECIFLLIIVWWWKSWSQWKYYDKKIIFFLILYYCNINIVKLCIYIRQAQMKLTEKSTLGLVQNIGETWFKALHKEFEKPYFAKVTNSFLSFLTVSILILLSPSHNSWVFKYVYKLEMYYRKMAWDLYKQI